MPQSQKNIFLFDDLEAILFNIENILEAKFNKNYFSKYLINN